MRYLSPWRCWPLGWLLFVASGALSQDAFFNIRHFSVEDGMSSRFVTNVVQDNQGFVWIGTDYGVNRFDGRNFKTYHSNKGNFRVTTRAYLFLDVKGNIWANNDRGQVDIIDPLNDVVMPLEGLMPRFKGKSVRLRGRDSRGVIWGTVENELVFRYDGRFHFFNAAFFNKEIDKVDNIFPSPWGTLLFARPTVLLEYDSLGNQLNAYPMPMQELTSFSITGSSVVIVRYEHLQGGKNSVAHFWELKECAAPELLKFSRQGKLFLFKDEISSAYASIGASRDAQGRFWVSYLNQLLVFGQRGELIAEAPTQKDYWQYLEANKIFFDMQGQAWVRGKQGVFLYSMRQPRMRKLLQGAENNISVRGLAQLGNDSLLASTYDGLFIINLKNSHQEKLIGNVFYGADNEGDSVVWFGSHAKTLKRFDTRLRKFEDVKVSDKLSQLDEYLRPFEDPFTGQVYIGTRHQGLLLYDKAMKEVVAYSRLNQFTEFAKLQALYLLPMPDCLWACTNDGLYQIDRQKGVVAKFNDFPSNYIYHLTIDKGGVFWMSTRGGGLVKWYKHNNLIRQYTMANGLSHDIVYAAYDDGKGHLWLPSNYGLMRFDKSSGSTVNYLPEEGASGEEYNSDAHLVGTDGTFYFGGLNGITAFHPDSIDHKRFSQPLVVTGLKILSGNAMDDRLSDYRKTNEIVVNPGELFFTLEFALLDFHAKKLVYAWNLESLDKNWIVQNENSIRFNGLPYGKYVLNIRAQGTGSIWSENEISIPITVVRPFHKTWKFAMLCVFGAALLTFFFVRWRLGKLRQEKERLERVVDDRTKELIRKNVELESTNNIKDRLFGIIAHDLRAPLVTLGGLARKVAFLMRQGRTEEVMGLGETVENSVANVRNLLDNLLKWAIVQDGKFPHNPESLRTAEVVEEVVELYSGIAEAKGIKLTLSNGDDPVVFADRNALSTIIRNLLDNAIKFTHEGGVIAIAFIGESNTTTIVEVCDSGMGIPQDILPVIFDLKGSRGQIGTKGEKGDGLGLVLCKELAEINGGNIEAQNRPEGGAIFRLRLPAKNPATI
jgi:signal transduction histidine kinase